MRAPRSASARSESVNAAVCVSRVPASIRIEPQVSDPQPTAAKLAAIAAPVPPLEPPGQRRGSYGFSVWPPNELIVVIPAASSCMFDFPMTMAPASRSRRTMKAYTANGRTDRVACPCTIAGRGPIAAHETIRAQLVDFITFILACQKLRCAASRSRLARSCAGANTCRCGRAACMPRVIGS